MSVRARGLRVYRGGRRVAGAVDVAADAGDVVHLAGPSGAGKSTLLKALGGLLALAPDAAVEGDVRVAGVDPRAVDAATLARSVGQVFQSAGDGLLAFDVAGEIALRLENLRVPEDEGAPRVDAALRQWGLVDLARRESARLSTGEAKRVALAAALVTDPPVLLLDEPLTGLDPSGRRAVRDALRGAARGRAVVVAEHGARGLADVVTRTVNVGDASGAPDAVPRVAAPRGEPVVRVDGVDAGRDGRTRVVRDASFTLEPGLVAVAGLNGAGKSTLLRAILGLDAPIAGRVTLAGLPDPHRARPRDVARRVGYAGPLSADLFTTTSVREEITLGARGVDADAVAAAFRLTPLLDRHPLALSGGERQRLAFAAAVAHAPRVLVLDEPTTGLDPAGRAALLHAVSRVVADGGVVLAATHDESLIAAAHRVLVVDDGRVSLEDDPGAFFSGAGRRLGYEAPPEVPA